MKPIFSDIFTNHLPKLDIHGETAATADLIIKEFIDDNYKQGIKDFVIIHGTGYGVLKQKTHEILKKDKRVSEFYISFFNTGCTTVKIKIDK